MPSVELYHGDNLDIFPLIEDESVDTVITDPPYGLKFMGKEWDTFPTRDRGERLTGSGNPTDARGFGGNVAYGKTVVEARQYQEWCTRWAAECLRVAKPGAMLCAFGGTRTHHRLMCAIEDAGWEIRDVLMYLYGSGFPKSHDVSKAIDRRRKDNLLPVTCWLNARVKEAGIRYAEILAHFGFNEGSGQVGHWTALSKGAQPAIPSWDQWLQLKALLGCNGEMDSEVWRLNGRKGKPGDAWAEREVIGKGQRNGGPPQPMWGDDDGQEWDITSPATDAAALWDGYGTALKPAYEPIILAMKPLPGTFAQNALGYGVAGLWVDGCRVDGPGWSKQDRDSGAGFKTGKFMGEMGRGEPTQQNGYRQSTQGRWPANLLLSHAPGCECVGVRKVRGNGPRGSSVKSRGGIMNTTGEDREDNTPERYYASPDGTETVEAWNCVPECPVRLLDEQSGELTSGHFNGHRNKPKTQNAYGDFALQDEQPTRAANTGGASRFFTRFHYSAKASRSERELGLLGHILCIKCGGLDTLTHINPKTDKEEKCRRNGHPTVKPLDVCRWLCRLTKTPTGGVVLDPFMGSGRIPMAAILEGRDTIGIELERPSFEIAEAAVAWAEEQVLDMVQGELEYA